MNESRQRLLDALNHRPTDRVPVDFGATSVSGIHCSCVAALRDAFGLEKRPVKIHEPYQMLGWIDPDLQQALGVDVSCPLPRKTMFGFANQNWKTWRTPWGQEVLIGADFQTTPADDGGLLVYPQGDRTAPPSAHMPAGGFFFDAIIRQQPIDQDNPDLQDNLEEFGPVTREWLGQLTADCRALRATGRAVLAWLPGTALGDIALVPATFLKHPKGIRDVADWYVCTAERPDYVHAIFREQTRIALDNLRSIAQAAKDLIDVVFICGTDFGTQSSTFCSPATFRSLWQPYYRQMTDWIHANTPWKVFKHSCGAVFGLIDDFIGSGFDILNPVQCSAVGMDPAMLKQKFGSRITFWGGGVDTQHTLPFGTPAEVYDQVQQRCRIFSPSGGFVFNTVHNIQANTPVPNILAMLKAIKEL